MTGDSGPRVRTSVREVVILVLGILIAFGLDSWWDGRTESAQRRADLAALRADFTSNRDQLADLVERQARISRSSNRLAEIAEGTGASADSVRGLLGQVFSSGRFEPVMGAYQALVASGGFSRLRDAELRAALANFAAAQDVRYVESYADALYFDLMHDFQGRLGLLFDPDSKADGANLLVDPSFRVALRLRASAEQEVGRRYTNLLGIADRVLALLERG